MKCRFCNAEVNKVVIDLGMAPPSNNYLSLEELNNPEVSLPLRVKVCENCFLTQTEDFASSSELFNDNYAYLSSTSSSWVKHAENYSKMITDKLQLNSKSFVVEIASNDGYLLKNFLQADIPCLGIEPTLSTAMIAEKKGIPTLKKFFSKNFAELLEKDYPKADLIIGNNVFAHVPDILDFSKGMKTLLKENGTITLEFPDLYNLFKKKLFDTIYHEHFSYLSLSVVKTIFEKVNLKIYNIDILETHGGSLRVYGTHNENQIPVSNNVSEYLILEQETGLKNISNYTKFNESILEIKLNLLDFLVTAKKQNKKVLGYGAAAKANTILNYSGIKPDLLPYICDLSLSKQNKFMPGSHIPIVQPDFINEYKPDYLIVFIWNILEEVQNNFAYIKNWGGKFVTIIPEFKIFD